MGCTLVNAVEVLVRRAKPTKKVKLVDVMLEGDAVFRGVSSETPFARDKIIISILSRELLA